jgi:hypothetical protein
LRILLSLLQSLSSFVIQPAEASGQTAHRGASGGAFTRVAGYRAADSTKRSTPAGALHDARLRWTTWLRVEICELFG